MRISDWSSDVCSSDLTARRGDVAAATVVTVGPPANYIEFTTSAYGIDAYPDAVTILPSGQERRIVTRLDPTDEFYADGAAAGTVRSEEHTSELQSLMRTSYAVFCLKKQTKHTNTKRE